MNFLHKHPFWHWAVFLIVAVSVYFYVTGQVNVAAATLETKLLIRGESSELSGTTNGSTVTLTTAPAGFVGALQVKGTGSVNFAPVQTGQGVYFCCGGQQQANTSFYKFTGTQLGDIFNVDQGEISFYLKSAYSFAERKLLPQYNYRYVFEVMDTASNSLFNFYVYANAGTSGRLIFFFNTGFTAGAYYYAPIGQEDILFGKDQILKVRLTWDGTNRQLFFNDSLMVSGSYTKATPNWTDISLFTFGSAAYISAGYFASDDIIDEFTILGPATSPPASDTTPPVRSAGSPSGTLASGTTSTTLSLTTDENATCKYSTTSGVSYASMTNTFSTTGGVSHSSAVSGLSGGNTYNYYVRCQDTAGNANTTDFAITFSVASPASDTTAPSIPAGLTATAISSSQINLSWTASTDNVGVTGYRVYRCTGSGCTPTTQIAASTASSYSNTGLSAATAYTYAVSAIDAASNESAKSSNVSATTQTAGTATPADPNNFVTITEKAGTTTTNYPVQIARPFKQGEIANFPQVIISGNALTTQADVKTRWPDGSVKHAILSFLIPTLSANTSVDVFFRNQSSGNNTPLTQTQMLDTAYDFDAVMELTNGTTVTASARQMLQNGDFTYWTSGPVATTVILADHSTARKYDIGFDSYKSFRPIFQATFWPTINKVRVRFIGEVSNTEALQDITVTNLVLKTGNVSPVQVYSKGTFTHTAASRWTKEFWIGSVPASIAINHNFSYLIATNFIPNFDTSKIIPESTIASEYSSWTNAAKDLYDAGQWTKYMPTTGGRPDIGAYPTWTIYWLYTADNRMRDKAFGNADLATAWPMHFREGATGKYFDRAHTVPALGKVLSISARPSLFTGVGNGYLTYTYTAADDKIVPVGAMTSGGWDQDGAHQPDPFSVQYTLTGDHFYLEEMQFWASWGAADANPGNIYYGRGPTGDYGGIEESVRGDGWLLRNRVQTAFLSPDNTPEKSYFNTLIDDAIGRWEGIRNITGTSFQGNTIWNWGNTVGMGRWGTLGPPPLHNWEKSTLNDGNIDPAVTKNVTSPWMEHYLIYALGRAKELGYKTDALLSWLGGRLVGQLTDSGFNPYLSAEYRTPIIRMSDGNWFTSWSEVKSGFLSSGQNLTTFPGTDFPSCTNCYSYIVLSATSMLGSEPGGAQAWDWISSKTLSQTALNSDPRWAIIPRVISSSDTTAPSIPAGLTATTVSASQINLSWTASTDNVGVTGYRIYRCAGSGCTPTTQIATSTASSYSNTGLSAATAYTYAVSAIDAAVNESAKSSNASATTQTAPSDTTPPVISSVIASSITATGATITWTTNELSDTQVEYGATISYGSSTTLDTSLVTSHSQVLSGLSAGTLYNYRVKSKDAASNLATSGNFTFTTAASPPVISSVLAGNISATSVTITWTTNKPSTSKVNYGLSASYTNSTVKDSALVTSHSVSIGGLSSSTLYHYQVESTDADNLTSVSADTTFTTAALVLPVISNVQSTNITTTGATITWTTDIAANSQVEYGLTTSYGSSTTLDSALVTNHSVALASLNPATAYNYRVKSSGSVSTNRTLATAGPTDTTAPAQTNNLAVSSTTQTSIVLSWIAPGDDGNVGTAATYQIRWFTVPITDGNWNNAIVLTGLPAPAVAGTTQTYTAIGLTPNTRYYFAMKTLDEVSNSSPLSNVPDGKTKKNAPNNIKNLSAAASDKSVQLGWSAPDNADPDVKYAVIKNTSGGLGVYNASGSNTLIYNGTAASFTDATVSNGITYYYSVFAYYDLGTYSGGVSVSALPQAATAASITQNTGGSGGGGYTFDVISPQPVKISRITEADSQILLEWTNPSDEDFVRVLIVQNTDRQPFSADDGQVVLEDKVKKYVAVNLQNGKTYYFNIYTLDLAKNFSEPVKIKASPKEGVTSFSEFVEPLDISNVTEYVVPELPITPAGETIAGPQIFPRSTLVRYVFDKNVYYIDKNGLRRLVPNYSYLLEATGNNPQKVIVVLDDKFINNYAPASPLEQKELDDISKDIKARSTLVKTKDKPTVYLINAEDQNRKVIPSLAVFYSFGFSFKNVLEIQEEDLDALTDAGVLDLKLLPEGFLMKSPDSYKVYIMQNGQKKWIKTLPLFLNFGFIDKDVTTLPKELIEAYPSGPDIEEQDEELPPRFQIKLPLTLHANSALVKLKDSYKVYLIDNGQLRWIKTLEEFRAKKYRFKDVITIVQDELGLYQMSEESEEIGITASPSSSGQ